MPLIKLVSSFSYRTISFSKEYWSPSRKRLYNSSPDSSSCAVSVSIARRPLSAVCPHYSYYSINESENQAQIQQTHGNGICNNFEIFMFFRQSVWCDFHAAPSKKIPFQQVCGRTWKPDPTKVNAVLQIKLPCSKPDKVKYGKLKKMKLLVLSRL